MALRSKVLRLLAVGLLSLSAVGFMTACDDEAGFGEREERFNDDGFGDEGLEGDGFGEEGFDEE